MASRKKEKFSYPREITFDNKVYIWNTRKRRYENENDSSNTISKRQFDTYVRYEFEEKKKNSAKVNLPRIGTVDLSSKEKDVSAARQLNRYFYFQEETDKKEEEILNKEIEEDEIIYYDEENENIEIIRKGPDRKISVEEKEKNIQEGIYYTERQGENGYLYNTVEFHSKYTTATTVLNYGMTLPEDALIIIYAYGSVYGSGYEGLEGTERWWALTPYTYKESLDDKFNSELYANIDVSYFKITYV